MSIFLSEVVRAQAAGEAPRCIGMTAELQDRLAQAVEIAWLQAINATASYVIGNDMAPLRHLSYVGSKGQVARLVDLIEQHDICLSLRQAFAAKDARPDEPGEENGE